MAALSSFTLAGPAAADDVPGCTQTFVGAASNPPSSGETIANNPKFWLSDGIHLFPQNVAPYVVTVANYEVGAAVAYVICVA